MAERVEAGTPAARCQSLEREGAQGGPQFSPPLYRQRYEAVLSACRRLQPAKVVDVGCAECRLLRLLRREGSVRELVGVDVQARLLEAQRASLQPLTSDFVQPRPHPLTVRLMQGSIAEPDQRLVGFDLLSCVEVIEHLDPPVLERVPAAIFGVLQPQVVVMTTPNADFNVLFPGFRGFRHPDHRFEWTRRQFQAWCSAVCEAYPLYSVEVSGVGEPPAESRHVGHCSQMATFSRTGGVQHRATCGTPYITVMECAYPHRKPLPLEQRLCHEAEFRLLQLLRQREREEEVEMDGEGEGDSDCVRIRLEELLQFKEVRALCSDAEAIKQALRGSAVVLRVEGLEAVLEQAGSSGSLDSGAEDSDRAVSCAVDCGLGECAHENWD